MSFEVRKVYRPVTAQEWREIMVARVKAALDADGTLTIMRSFPMFNYKISIGLTPFRPQGIDQSGKTIPPLPGTEIVYECDGQVFVPVFESQVELVEQSPVYGHDADPQSLRTLAAQPTIEKGRSEIGEVIDIKIPPPKPKEPEETFVPTAPPVPIVPGEKEDETIKVEESRWSDSRTDSKAEQAIAERNPDLAPGRVSVIQSVAEGGGQNHGRGKKQR